MKRRTFNDVRVSEIVAERTAVLTLRLERDRQIGQVAARGRLTTEEAEAIKTELRVFADMIATGLHREEADPAGVRDAMRAVVRHG